MIVMAERAIRGVGRWPQQRREREFGWRGGWDLGRRGDDAPMIFCEGVLGGGSSSSNSTANGK